MPGLKRGVLAVVGKSKELTFISPNRAGRAIHPAQGARYQQGRRGAPPFCRQACQLVDFTRLSGGLILTCRAEMELSGQEPCRASSYADCSIWCHGNFPWPKT